LLRIEQQQIPWCEGNAYAQTRKDQFTACKVSIGMMALITPRKLP